MSPQWPVLQYTSFLNSMKPLYKMSISWSVLLTAAMGPKSFQTVSIALHTLSPSTFDKLCFFSGGEYGCHGPYTGWSQWPFGSKWHAVLSSHSQPGNRCHLEGRKHGWTHWFLTTRPWQSCHWSMGKWENEDLEVLGVGVQLLAAKARAPSAVPARCSVTNSPFPSLSFVLRRWPSYIEGNKMPFLFFCDMITRMGSTWSVLFWNCACPWIDPVLGHQTVLSLFFFPTAHLLISLSGPYHRCNDCIFLAHPAGSLWELSEIIEMRTFGKTKSRISIQI